MIQKNLIGIYSFPKSGNTWVRHIISALFSSTPELCCPNIYEEGLPTRYIQLPRADANSSQSKRFAFYKSHGFQPIYLHDGVRLQHRAFIYVIRHPLDVFMSYLNYELSVVGGKFFELKYKSVDEVIAANDLDLFFSTFCVLGTVRPSFMDAGSWMLHVKYWILTRQAIPVILLRYEELVSDPIKALNELCGFLAVGEKQLIEALSIANKATQIDGAFFWRRNNGGYRDFLTKDQIARFYRLHGEIAQAAGYPLTE